MIFQFGPSTPNYSNLGHCIPIWSLFRNPVFQLGSFWGRIFQFGPFSSTYIPMWVTVMELFQYGPHRCRLSVVAGVLGGTHCESVPHDAADKLHFGDFLFDFPTHHPSTTFYTTRDGSHECVCVVVNKVFARERARLLHEHRYLGIMCVTLGPTTRVFYPN